MKKGIVFSLIFFGTCKHDYVINARKMFSFLVLVNELSTAE